MRQALGRGLDALLPPAPAHAGSVLDRRVIDGSMFQCPIERIVPRQDQPRRRIDKDAIEELASSIRAHGLIEPVVVRRMSEGEDRFELIAGERRWLACQQAGLKIISTVVKNVTSDQAYVMALVENLQREDLNPIEIAEAYERLLRQPAASQQSVAQQVGKSRVAVANVLRLLRLPAALRRLVHDGTLSEGHARALLGAADEASMRELADRAVRGRLTVRQVEQLVRTSRRRATAGADPPSGSPAKKSAAVRDLEARLARKLGTRAEVIHQTPGGEIRIHYGSLDDLDRVLAIIGV